MDTENEKIVLPLHAATTESDLRQVLEQVASRNGVQVNFEISPDATLHVHIHNYSEANMARTNIDSSSGNHAGSKAIGDNPRADSRNISQVVNSNSCAKEFDELANQLSLLSRKMSQKSEGLSHYKATVAVGEAVEAAQKGDNASMIQFLKNAGSWALSVAKEISVPLAEAALKQALRL